MEYNKQGENSVNSVNLEHPHKQAINMFSKYECREKDLIFEREELIGVGSYGKVYKAYYKEGAIENNSSPFALKQLLVENPTKEGFPVSALREIRILKKIKHKNVANLKEIIQQKPKVQDENGPETKEGNKSNLIKIYLVFEYMNHDLYGLIHSSNVYFNYKQMKNIMFQILEGVRYLHSVSLIHRDLKSSNILMNNKGEIKITDFGLSRFYNPSSKSPLTNCVVTLWYRAPEILLGSSYYDSSSDIWSVGCILVELLLGYVPFRGRSENDQIEQIYKVLGTATDENWSGVNKLKYYSSTLGKQIYYENKLKQELTERYEEKVVDLIMRMLCYDPKNRITADQALDHSFFTSQPYMCRNDEMPYLRDDFHEIDINEKKDYCKIGNITNLLQEKESRGDEYNKEKNYYSYSSRKTNENSSEKANEPYYNDNNNQSRFYANRHTFLNNKRRFSNSKNFK